MSLNKVILLGNLGKDPVSKTTDSGHKYCHFSVATNRKRKDGTKDTQWHSMVAWNKTSDLVMMYLKKGSQALFEGELTYYTKNDETIPRAQVNVNQVTFVNATTLTESSTSKEEVVLHNVPEKQVDFDELPF